MAIKYYCDVCNKEIPATDEETFFMGIVSMKEYTEFMSEKMNALYTGMEDMKQIKRKNFCSDCLKTIKTAMGIVE